MNKINEPFLSWAEIDRSALRHNYKVLHKISGELLPVIKADAYGHGMLEAAAELYTLGVKIFGVSDVVEGMELRRNGFKNEILLLEAPLPEFAADIVNCDLTASICTLEMAGLLNKHAKIRGQKLKVHIKVDTGMGRLGIWHEDAAEFIHRVSEFSHLIIDGIFTHFPLADTNRSFTEKQIKIFSDLIHSLGQTAHSARYIHAANSTGLSKYRSNVFNLARPGLMLYGLCSTEELKKKMDLKPVMEVRTRVIYVKTVKKGRGISYGHTFVAKKSIKAATLAIGYSDGYFRSLSNKAWVLIHGKRCPVIGNVTMDQIMVDVSAVPSVKIGDTAVVLGRDKKQSISAEELARFAGTINYEIICNLGNRVARVYK